MVSFLLAVQFLTILPVEIKDYRQEKFSGATMYFPLVGLMLGVLLIGVVSFLHLFVLPAITMDILLVVALIVVTGGMHLDGLSDTADALCSGKSKEEMLAIMRDPHIGVMGVLSLISVILLKAGLLFALPSGLLIQALILMCVISRWSAVLAMFLFPYARKEGKAKPFISEMNFPAVLISILFAILLVFAAGQFKGLLILSIIAGFVCISGKYFCNKIGGISGDTLGATIEVSEILVLLFILILMR